jgi:uncharacterized membrane protein YebE (DUF533 family)
LASVGEARLHEKVPLSQESAPWIGQDRRFEEGEWTLKYMAKVQSSIGTVEFNSHGTLDMNSNDLMKALFGAGGARAAPSSLKGNDLLDKVLNSGMAGGVAGGALSGALTGMLFGKKGKKLKKFSNSALKAGGIAAIGGLAYLAYNRYRQQSATGFAATAQPIGNSGTEPALPPPGTDFLPAPEDAVGRNAVGLALIRAMIAAAKADGHIDAAEQQRIFGQIGRLELTADEKAFLLEELSRPLDIDAIVRLGTSPEIAAEIFTASLLAVDVDTPAERAYLDMLAARLRLEPRLIQQIHATVVEG